MYASLHVTHKSATDISSIVKARVGATGAARVLASLTLYSLPFVAVRDLNNESVIIFIVNTKYIPIYNIYLNTETEF